MPSNVSPEKDERRRSIAALLNRLALHCPVRNLPATQAALLMEDTIRDLLDYDPREVAQACEAWRRGTNPFFPISGQLIALVQRDREASIAHRRATRPAYRALPETAPALQIAHHRGPVKPWRQILAEHGKLPPVAAHEEKAAPAEQERLEADGSLPEERKAELLALRLALRARAGLPAPRS